MSGLTKVKYAIVMISLFLYIPLAVRANTVKEGTYSEFAFTKEQIKELNALIKGCGPGVSVSYKDLDSGYTYLYNEEQKYFIASLIKAPYCMYIYDLASQDKCDLNKVYTYAVRHKAGGTGNIQNMPVGTRFTLEELIGYAIKYSDNVAMNILKENFPVEDYKAYAKGLGLKYPEDIKNGTNGTITAIDAGIYIEAIHTFINHNTYGSRLKSYMLATRNPMIVASNPVIRKYGWANASFHDMAIIEAPYPYLLSICTNHDGDYSTFKKISQLIERYTQSERGINYLPVIRTISIGGRREQLSGLNINNNTYYKLRDIAYLLNGTNKQFDIVYDTEKLDIIMELGKSYLGDRSIEDMSSIKKMKLEEKQVSLYLKDEKHQMLGYSVDGNTYMRLRDLVELLEMEVEWSDETKEIVLVTWSENNKVI